MLHAVRQKLGGAFRTRWIAWVTRRIPPSREVLLSQKNIFIFPSPGGFIFLLLLLSLMLAGINYENNLVFALAFLLSGMFVVTILHTYANLAGLRLIGAASRAVFAGEEAGFNVRLRAAPGRCHDGVELRWPVTDMRRTRILPGREDAQLLFVPAPRRGLLRPGRLLLQSRFPLGLIRAWSWIDLDFSCVVYPRPAPNAALAQDSGCGNEGYATADPGVEDFSGFRNYRPGDPLRHVAWKTLAKGQPLQTREYIAFADRRRWLDWEQTQGCGGTEERLSLLCRWVLELHRLRAEFGLRLPGFQLEAGSDDAHRDKALTALALFGHADTRT